MNDSEEHLCRRHVTKACGMTNMHMVIPLNALACVLSSAYFSHFSICTRTYTWRAAHLANRPHYTGGWTIDPLVVELKKSHFSSLSFRMCDMMSWSYLPALCSMTANLTCNPETLHLTTKNVCCKIRWNVVMSHGISLAFLVVIQRK